MKRISSAIVGVIAALVLSSCGAYYKVIPNVTYQQPVESAQIIYHRPADMSGYMGSMKIVPSDFVLYSAPQKKKVFKKLMKEAAAAGARYVYVRGLEVPGSDLVIFKGLDVEFGEGVTLDAELYRHL